MTDLQRHALRDLDLSVFSGCLMTSCGRDDLLDELLRGAVP